MPNKLSDVRSTHRQIPPSALSGRFAGGMMKDFSRSEMEEMTKMIAGKTIESARVDDDHSDDFLVFRFTDGTELKIRYDWIYEYDLTTAST